MKSSNLSLILLLLFTLACAHSIQEYEEENFIPPAVLTQPRIIYPADAQQKAYTGNTKLILSITDLGTVNKIYLEKSSGYEILDNAAIEYCKNLVFVPGKINDKNVYSRLRWEIKFKVSDWDWNAKKYVEDINDLYNSLMLAARAERIRIEREIVKKHDDYVSNMTDGLNFNLICEQVIQKNISAEWKKHWNAWPLTFLLYHDFIIRFPEYDSLSIIKARLVNAVKADIQFIRNTPDIRAEIKSEKENVLLRIKNFIRKYYPEISTDNLGIDKGDSQKAVKHLLDYAIR